MLRTLYIIICGCQQLGNHTLNIITDISCFRQRSRICDRKRHIQKLRQSLDQISLSTTSRPDHQHIGFLNLDLIHGIRCHTFIMIINSNRHHLLRSLLTDHILIQCLLDLMRRRNILQIQNRLLFLLFLLRLLRLLNRILKTT